MIGPFFVAFQEEPTKPVHPAHKSSANVTEDRLPVSAKEAAQTFDRVIVLVTRIAGAKLGLNSVPSLDRPVTRAEVVREMDRLIQASGSIIRFTPLPFRHDPSVFRIDGTQKPALDRLVSMGCVGKIGPLATGPSNTLSVKEFGDAVGFFVARLAQMSHMPSPKWTPMLQEP